MSIELAAVLFGVFLGVLLVIGLASELRNAIEVDEYGNPTDWNGHDWDRDWQRWQAQHPQDRT